MKAFSAAACFLLTVSCLLLEAHAEQSRPLFLRRRPVIAPDPTEYVPLARVVPGLPAARRDPISRECTFAARRTLVLVPGFSQVKAGDQTIALSRPVLYHSGRLFIPAKDADRLKRAVNDSRQLSATAAPVALTRADRRVVVIDPGHGGHDPGAIRHGVREKDVNLKIARLLKKLLAAKDFSVTMTRTTDRFIELEERAAIANRLQADYFISIHANSEPSGNISGVEVYYCDSSARYDPVARGLLAARTYKLDALKLGFVHQPTTNVIKITYGLLIEDARRQSRKLAAAVCSEVSRRLGAASRGARPGPFRVLRHANCPAVLVETGFLSHRGEVKRLADPSYQKRIAQAIADALARYDAMRCD